MRSIGPIDAHFNRCSGLAGTRKRTPRRVKSQYPTSTQHVHLRNSARRLQRLWETMTRNVQPPSAIVKRLRR